MTVFVPPPRGGRCASRTGPSMAPASAALLAVEVELSTRMVIIGARNAGECCTGMVMVGPVAPVIRRGRRACLPSRAQTYSASNRAQPGYGTEMVRMYPCIRWAGPRTTRLSAVLGVLPARGRNAEPAQEWSGFLADLRPRSQRSTGRTGTSTGHSHGHMLSSLP